MPAYALNLQLSINTPSPTFPFRKFFMAKSTARDIPTVLAFARSLNPGHMLMFSSSTSRPGHLTPVVVREEPLRGLNATRKSKDDERKQAVLQVVESAELAAGDDTLVLRGKLLVRNNVRAPFSCNESYFGPLQEKLVDDAAAAGQVKELATRYAVNLLGGLWGWRNAMEAEHISVTVRWTQEGQAKSVTVDNLVLSTENRFDVTQYPEHADAIAQLADAIAKGLTGSGRGILLRVQADLLMGEGARVYPSQEWASESMKASSKRDWTGGEGVTRVLAKVRNANGEPQAIINDRKAGNALRVVDTWYTPEAAVPIAAEIYGANSHQGVALRPSGTSFFSALEKVVNGQQLSAEETLFYLAVCIRGGVLGGKE